MKQQLSKVIAYLQQQTAPRSPVSRLQSYPQTPQQKDIANGREAEENDEYSYYSEEDSVKTV